MESPTGSKLDVRKLCFIMNLTALLDFISVGMIFPLLAGHLRDLGASTSVIGIVGSIYGAVQLISSPLAGKISDSVGPFPVFVMTMVMSGVGYVIVGISTSIPFFAIGRLVLGFFKHGQALGKAYLYGSLPEKEASAAVGRFHSFSTMGFILGPVIGGHLAETSGGVPLVSYCSAVIYFVNTGIIWWLLPQGNISKQGSTNTSNHEMDKTPNNNEMESTPNHELEETRNHEMDKLSPIGNGHHTNHIDHPKAGQESSFISSLIKTYRNNCSLKAIRSSLLLMHWDLLLINCLAAFALIMFRTNIFLNLREKHGAGATTVGYITSFSATVNTISGFFIGFIIKRYKHDEAKLFFHVCLLEMVSLMFIWVSPSIPIMLLFMVPLGLGTTISRVTSTSVLVNVGGKQHVASTLGWNQSSLSLSRMFAPTFVGLIQEWDMDGSVLVSAMVLMITCILIFIFPQDHKLRKSKKEE